MTDMDTKRPGVTDHVRTGEQSITHRREFSAPAAAVQRAHTEAELFVRWMGPRGTTVSIDRFEAVTGGGFRYVVKGSSGGGAAFFGSYHEVSPGRIVHTWEYEDEQGVTLETLEFSDVGPGLSLLEVQSTYTSKDACDAMLASGLDGGMDTNFERLDEVLAGS